MLEGGEVARILDILGNRNRRRIIELLRQKPCFVTEISERLVLSPKAVIDHLQMMERERLLISRQDERRRKYYYLSHDINVIVNLQKQDGVNFPVVNEDQKTKFARELTVFRKMIQTRDELLDSLEQLERDIESKFADIARVGRDFVDGDGDMEIILALSHFDPTLTELKEVCSLPMDELNQRLNNLISIGVVEQTNDRYQICGIHGE